MLPNHSLGSRLLIVALTYQLNPRIASDIGAVIPATKLSKRPPGDENFQGSMHFFYRDA